MTRFPSAIRAVCFQLEKARQITGCAHAEWLREAFRQRAIRLPCVPKTEIDLSYRRRRIRRRRSPKCGHAARVKVPRIAMRDAIGFCIFEEQSPPHTMGSIQQMYKRVRVFGDEPSRQSCIRRQSDVVTRYFFSFESTCQLRLTKLGETHFLRFLSSPFLPPISFSLSLKMSERCISDLYLQCLKAKLSFEL